MSDAAKCSIELVIFGTDASKGDLCARIAIDVGDEDGLRPANELLDAEMTRFAIPHQFTVYRGDHGNQVPARFANQLLPFFASALAKAQ